jgi:hypothetical protein
VSTESPEAILAEIREILREQTRIAQSSVDRAIQFQKNTLLWVAIIAVVLLTPFSIWVWERRGREIEINRLNEEALRLQIESEKRAAEQFERRPGSHE